MVPNFDARKFGDLPIDVWKVLYPLPYESVIRREAAKNNFDPMLAAGLMRQESTFQADALSPQDAIGLMQVIPKTGRLLAKQLRVCFSPAKLFQPDYNIQLGMLYISGLVKLTERLLTRWRHSTPGKTALRRGKPSATTTKSPSSWNPFPSAKHAITCKSSCAIPKSTG